MDAKRLVSERIRELHSATRSEVLGAIVAAVFFIAIVAWRMGSPRDLAVELGLALVFLWIVVSILVFRRRLGTASRRAEEIGKPCLDYYRAELRDRRDHLRNEWLWHGPLFLACLVFILTIGRGAYTRPARMWSIAPLLALLAAWAVFGYWRRRRQAAEIQHEIDEVNREFSESGGKP